MAGPSVARPPASPQGDLQGALHDLWERDEHVGTEPPSGGSAKADGTAAQPIDTKTAAAAIIAVPRHPWADLQCCAPSCVGTRRPRRPRHWWMRARWACGMAVLPGTGSRTSLFDLRVRVLQGPSEAGSLKVPACSGPVSVSPVLPVDPVFKGGLAGVQGAEQVLDRSDGQWDVSGFERRLPSIPLKRS